MYIFVMPLKQKKMCSYKKDSGGIHCGSEPTSRWELLISFLNQVFCRIAVAKVKFLISAKETLMRDSLHASEPWDKVSMGDFCSTTDAKNVFKS